MRVLFARLVCLVVVGGSLCVVATCHREVPPVQPIETRPAGPKPTAVPAIHPHWPDAVPASIAPQKPPPGDGGVDAAPLLQPLSDGKVPLVGDGASPMMPGP